MRRLPVALPFALLLACGGGDDDGSAAPDAGYNCALDDRGETFAAGMSKTGAAGYGFTLVDAIPAPPDRYENDWQVAVTDPDGAAAADVDLSIVLFMPDHGHGSGVTPVVTADGAGGFAIDRINLFMPGLWEITLRANAGGDRLDEVTFNFCVEG